MDFLARVQSVLKGLQKPLFDDDPISTGGRRTEFDFNDSECNGLKYKAFFNRMMTFGVQNWGGDPNSAVYLAKHGFKNVSDMKVHCCSCYMELDLKVFRGKTDILRSIALSSHKPSCRWLYVSTPGGYFKICRNPRKAVEDLLTTVTDLVSFEKQLPQVPDNRVLEDSFIKDIMDVLGTNSYDPNILLSAVWLSLCGWVKASDNTIQCNFCRRVYGLWNLINYSEESCGHPTNAKTEGRVVSILFSQIRGEVMQCDEGNKNELTCNDDDSMNQSQDPSPFKDIPPDRVSENMSISNCNVLQLYETPKNIFSLPTRSFFCAQSKKRSAIRILNRKMRLLLWKQSKTSKSGFGEPEEIVETKCYLSIDGEPNDNWCSVSEYHQLSGSITEESARNSVTKDVNCYGKNMNSDTSNIQQNGFSSVEYVEDDHVDSKTELSSDKPELTNELVKSPHNFGKQNSDQSELLPEVQNSIEASLHNETEPVKKLHNSELETHSCVDGVSSNLNRNDSGPVLIQPCNSEDASKMDSSNDGNALDMEGSTNEEHGNISVPKCEQNGSSSGPCHEIGKPSNAGINCENTNDDCIAKTKQLNCLDKDVKVDSKAEPFEKNNGFDVSNADPLLTESMSEQQEKNNLNFKTYNESENNYEHFNAEENQLTPVICSVVGNAFIPVDASDGLDGVASPQKDEISEGPIIVSSNTVCVVEITDSIKVKDEPEEEMGNDCAAESTNAGDGLQVDKPSSSKCSTQCVCTIQYSTSNTDEQKIDDGDDRPSKRKRDDDSPGYDALENAKKKLREAYHQLQPVHFDPVLDHRYWCVWKMKTSDTTGIDDTPRAGWQYAYENLKMGFELLKKDKDRRCAKMEEKTVRCIRAIYSMENPG